MSERSRESRGQRIKLTQHLPRSNHTIEIVENCPRGGSNRVSALMQDNLRVEHRSNGRLVRRRSADTSNAKVPEVYAELSSLDTRAILPINVVRYHPSWSESKRVALIKSSTEGLLQGERLVGCQGVIRPYTLPFCLFGGPTEGSGELLDTFGIEVIEAYSRSRLLSVILPHYGALIGWKLERGLD